MHMIYIYILDHIICICTCSCIYSISQLYDIDSTRTYTYLLTSQLGHTGSIANLASYRYPLTAPRMSSSTPKGSEMRKYVEFDYFLYCYIILLYHDVSVLTHISLSVVRDKRGKWLNFIISYTTTTQYFSHFATCVHILFCLPSQ